MWIRRDYVSLDSGLWFWKISFSAAGHYHFKRITILYYRDRHLSLNISTVNSEQVEELKKSLTGKFITSLEKDKKLLNLTSLSFATCQSVFEIIDSKFPTGLNSEFSKALSDVDLKLSHLDPHDPTLLDKISHLECAIRVKDRREQKIKEGDVDTQDLRTLIF